MLRRSTAAVFTNIIEGPLRWHYNAQLNDAMNDVRSVAAVHGRLDATTVASQLNEGLIARGYQAAYARVYAIGAKAHISPDELTRRIHIAADRGYNFGFSSGREGNPLL